MSTAVNVAVIGLYYRTTMPVIYVTQPTTVCLTFPVCTHARQPCLMFTWDSRSCFWQSSV